MRELDLHDVFPMLKKEDSVYAGVFDSKDHPYEPSAPVRCNYFSSMLFKKGTGFLVVDNYEYEVKPNRILVFSNRQVIGWGSYENTVAHVLAFTPAIALDINIKPYGYCIDLAPEELIFYSSVYQKCIDVFQQRDDHSEHVLHAAIGYLYALLNAKTSNPVPGDAVMSSFHHWVCDNFSSSYTVDEIASILSVSSTELNERCLEKLGVTAKQYILELKLTEAKRLLVFTDDNNAQIAFATGFEDPSYFARIFRKKAGLTPSDYRKKYRK